MNNAGLIIVISGPSGSGKSTVIREILAQRTDCTRSVSYTTRLRRPYEVNGVHYRFISRTQFEEGIASGRFLEWAEVHGEYYGTDRYEIERTLESGRHVIMDIDVNGGENIRKIYPDQAVLIFLHPPSPEELRRRLRARGTDDYQSIERRLARYPFEKSRGDNYDYLLVNEDLNRTVAEIMEIIDRHAAQLKAKAESVRNQQPTIERRKSQYE